MVKPDSKKVDICLLRVRFHLQSKIRKTERLHMNNNPVPIQDALKVALHTKNVEVIPLALQGEERVLLRSTLMPEFAFLLWSKHRSDTRSWLGLEIPDVKCADYSGYRSKSYQVVCACCDTQVCGVTRPKTLKSGNFTAYKQWSSRLGEKFKRVLTDTCAEHRIKIVFMRRAGSWDQHYGAIDGIEIVEAQEHQEAMQELYGRTIVEANTRFISRKTSEGMF